MNKKKISSAETEENNASFFENSIWLSTKDAAIYLRKFRKDDDQPSDGAIRTAVWRGILPARKWRRRLYIKRSDLERMIMGSPSTDGGSR
jgi:hypothetical protein